jgi:hypothetical protein
MNRRLFIVFTGLTACVAVLIGGMAASQAQTTFAANDGDWSDPLNWNNGVPANNTWAAINDGRTLDVTPGAVVGLLDIGAGAGQTGNLTIGAGADLNAVAIRAGQAGGAIGNVTQTGGTVSANGALGGPFLEGDILLGDAGTGAWTISDGTLTAQDEFLIGFINTGEGTLNVDGGTVNAGRVLTVGVLGNGKGALNVSDGVVNANGDLLSSLFAGTSSTLTQSGGTINVGQHFIHGLAGPSSYNQTGGAVNVTGRLTVAENNTSASWDLADGSITATHIFLGDFDNSHGTMTVSGGSMTLSGNLNVGAASASNAASNPPGHALNADGTLIVSGPEGTINVGGNLLANAGDNPRFGGGGEHNDSLLVFEANSGGVSMIDVAGIADLTGAEIDVDLLSAFSLGTTFDLITATSISADYLQAAEDIGLFTLAIVPGGNGEILRATFVPEPTSMMMLVVGVARFCGSRRQRGC